MMVAVHVSPKGVRLSRVERHGESVVDADAETRALAVLLWARVARQEPTGHAMVWPTIEQAVTQIERLAERVDRLAVRAEQVLHRLEYTPVPEGPRPAASGGR